MRKKMVVFLNMWVVILLVVTAGLNLATVRKKDADDPILNTQTDPIAYKEKMEEIKDGEKGAPSPSFKLYPKEKFLVEPPMESKKNRKEAAPAEAIPENSLKDLDQKKEENLELDYWDEDEPGEGQEDLKEEGDLDVSSGS